ncbi:Conidiophore development regulator abaA [Fusarium euwallaceae]|uniref:Conidiophore development regulator abaA n=3 Tax=Fusarium solani species complex TaxID=232080 RepID=A0A3M2SHT3_9HYPO|nr:Conidiophore development regulator abaA [Fusarium kuroshium]RSM10623.1 Conidiophore development regulator abaA [Fusarium oligoseptatum]RTE81170.1 Conidiophore development regulator abaA [Fusarium euwallaceae]
MSSSSLYHPRPVLSSQRYTPSPDYLQDARRTYHNNSRLPLREANSNVQSHNFNGMVSCYQSPVGISPSVPQSLPAPMVPSQSFDCLYRVPTPRGQPRGFQRRPRSGVNPLYFWPAFRQYRNRQAHKDTQKDKGGVWRRPELEDAFVDSVLLMPHMGRRKFSMGGKLHGRNMLISEYIFVICVAILGSKEIFRIDNSNDSIEQMGRKQVSSHMQVVKKFFEDLRCFHFLFPAEEKKEPGSTNSDDYYDEEEQESFKSNPVLTALAEGRVPDVKPNYEYFSQLLALQSLITVRPKTAEVYVSSSEVKIRDDIAYDSHDTPLDQDAFPHLNKYSNCDDSPTVLGKDVLLHEYTRSLDRSTSACVKTVTRRWQKDAPEIYETLDLPTRDEECLLLEMCATLELHDHARFPSGSELTGFVEVAITQPNLQNHRWKCVTRLTRPSELHGDDKKQGVYTNETGIHRRGCGDSKPDCDCHSRPRQDIHVPFPAVEWASILSQAVQYPDVEHQRKKEKRSKGDGDRKKHDLDRAGSKRKRSEDDGDAASWARRELTGSDLICKVAMYQELWSCAPDSTRWVRQGIIFWRFNTTNQWYKYNPVFKPAGTSWRWLTVNDPMSRYHQQKALVYPSATVSRDSIMSPTPSINQHMTAAMNETFSSAWDTNVSLAQTVPAANNGMTLFESFSNGLATPPPTAGLQGSYPTSFDHGMPPSTGVGFLPSTCSTAGESQSVGGHAHSQSYYDVQTTLADLKPAMSAVNPFQGPAATTGLDLSNPLVYDNSECEGLQGWDMPTLDGWSTGTGAGSDWGSQGAKVEPSSDQTSLWTQSQWTQMGADRDGSPRPMKRRRGDTIEGHVPVTMAAGAW